jgi:hypothetical protein
MPSDDGDDEQQQEQEQHAAPSSPASGAPAPASATPNPSKDQHFSPLSRIPLDIQDQREALFLLETPMVLEGGEWDRYFPYVAAIGHSKSVSGWI